jgi:hypothetical protein
MATWNYVKMPRKNSLLMDVVAHLKAELGAPSRLARHSYLGKSVKVHSYFRPRKSSKNSEAKRTRKLSKVELAVEKTTRDMNTFYAAFDIVRQVSSTQVPTRQERVEAYRRMECIAETYGNPALQNKLDEAEDYLRTRR